VFESDGRYACVVMVDDADDSFKQEQTPMYETRQVLLARGQIYGFDIVFVGVSPSPELMAMTIDGEIKLIEAGQKLPKVRLVDLTNYKFVPGMISPPLRDALEASIKNNQMSLLVLNRKGSYKLTRCIDCGEVLKCSHCDSSLIYSRSEGKFLCRHCTFSLPGETVCPKCHKPSWKSQGIGVQQVKSELKKIFPLAKIASFERGEKLVLNSHIIISTRAILRFQGQLSLKVAGFIDFDGELNRLDMRAAFNAFSLVLHIGDMAQEVFIQTRNFNHYVLESLARGDIKGFYDEELKLRKEFGFSPFKHWIKINCRGKSEKTTLAVAHAVYNALTKDSLEHCVVTAPQADTLSRKRDQFHFNVMVQANEVKEAMSFIKSRLARLKRAAKVIVTLNVDP